MDSYLVWFVVISLIYSVQGRNTSSTSQPLQPSPSTTVSKTNQTANHSAQSTAQSSQFPVSPKAISTNSVKTSNPSITYGTSQSIFTSMPHPIKPNTTSPVKPNTTHVSPNTTTAHRNGTHVPPTETLVPPTGTHVPPTETMVPPTGTHVPPTETLVPPIHSSPTQAPTKSAGKGDDDDDYDSMKKRMWVAASFAIIFALTTVILAYLVYRQRKINRDLEGDPASSRLL